MAENGGDSDDCAAGCAAKHGREECLDSGILGEEVDAEILLYSGERE